MSTTQNLIWDDYSKDIENGFCEIYKTGLLHDVTLSAEGRRITAHKLILALSSQHFKELFSDHSTQNQQTIVFIGNVRYQILQILVEFMYTGEVTVSENLLEEVLKGAQILNIKALLPKGSSVNNAEQTTEGKRSKRVSRIPFRYQSDDIQPKKKKVEEEYLPDSNALTFVELNGSNVNVENQVENLYGIADTNLDQEETVKLEPEVTLHCEENDPLPDTSGPIIKTEEDDKSCIPILNNSVGPSSLKYIRNKNGNFCLVVNDHIYTKQATHKDRVFWRCQMYNRLACKSRCVTLGNNIIRRVAIHSHAPQTDKVIECEIKGDIVYM